MGTFSLGGTAQARGLSKVDPRLVDILQQAAAQSPYNVQLFSGSRPGDRRYHGSGNAVDIVLSDPSTGQEIPNLKSSVGFPIYEQFAKTARAVQEQTYPDLTDTFRWGGYFSGGKGKYGSVDLMHFDLGPTWKMAGGSWETGLTPEQAKIIAGFGVGQVYSGTGQRAAGLGEYANLWGREPLQAPQDAQSAIAGLLAPSGGTLVPDAPTAAMGYAPNLLDVAPLSPPMPPVQTAAAPPPFPVPPPSWATAGDFPIDEALTGASAQDVLMGGPRMDPRRIAPGSAPIAPDMGSMRSPADVLAAGPRLRPGGAPDASEVSLPVSRLASGVLPPPPLSVAMRNPPMRPGGAPDAGLLPMPPPRASGLPLPPPRPDIDDPSLSFNRQSGRGPDMRGALPPIPSMVAGRPEFLDAPPPASRIGDLSAAMGNAPPPPLPGPYDDWTRAFDIPPPLSRAADNPLPERLNVTPYFGNADPAASGRVGDLSAAMGDLPPAAWFDNANPSFSRVGDLSAAMGGPPAPFPIGTVTAGSTGGEFFSSAPPMPAPPPAMSQAMQDQFDVAFSPGGPGQIMDMQTAFNRRGAPPPVSGQMAIDQLLGPSAAMGALPFTEIGPTPAAANPAASLGSSLGPITGPRSPSPSNPTDYNRYVPNVPSALSPAASRFSDAAFGGGSVVVPPPAASPTVIDRWTAQNAEPIDIRPPVQGGPPLVKPATALSPPRQTNVAAEREKQGFARSILGAIFGGGGIGGFGSPASFTPFGGGMMTTPMGSFRTAGTSPYGVSGSTQWKSGTSNALGGSNALTYTDSHGNPLTVTQDPWTGTYYGPVAG